MVVWLVTPELWPDLFDENGSVATTPGFYPPGHLGRKSFGRVCRSKAHAEELIQRFRHKVDQLYLTQQMSYQQYHVAQCCTVFRIQVM